MRKNRSTNEIAPQRSSLVSGRIGLGAFWQSSILPPFSSLSMHSRVNLSGFWVVWATAEPAGTKAARTTTAASTALLVRMATLLARDDEREDEAEEGECLGEGDAQEHRRAGHAS